MDWIVVQGVSLFWILVRRVLPRFLVFWILILGVLGFGGVHKSLCLVSRRYLRSGNKGLKVGTLSGRTSWAEAAWFETAVRAWAAAAQLLLRLAF